MPKKAPARTPAPAPAPAADSDEESSGGESSQLRALTDSIAALTKQSADQAAQQADVLAAVSSLQTSIQEVDERSASVLTLVEDSRADLQQLQKAQEAQASRADEFEKRLAGLKAGGGAGKATSAVLGQELDPDDELSFAPHYARGQGIPDSETNPFGARPLLPSNAGKPQVFEPTAGSAAHPVWEFLRQDAKTGNKKGTLPQSYHEFTTLNSSLSYFWDVTKYFGEVQSIVFDDSGDPAQKKLAFESLQNSVVDIEKVLRRRFDIVSLRAYFQKEGGELVPHQKLLLDRLQSAIQGFDKGLGLTAATDSAFRGLVEKLQRDGDYHADKQIAREWGSAITKVPAGGGGGDRQKPKTAPRANKTKAKPAAANP